MKYEEIKEHVFDTTCPPQTKKEYVERDQRG